MYFKFADGQYVQRIYCKIRSKLGYSSIDIYADLQRIYRDNALHYGPVVKWVRRFIMLLTNILLSHHNFPNVNRENIFFIFLFKHVTTTRDIVHKRAKSCFFLGKPLKYNDIYENKEGIKKCNLILIKHILWLYRGFLRITICVLFIFFWLHQIG